ncbi:microtubule-associated protein futsch-like isoform X2 [Homarus americanus]|uniref:microtubule-associated protein futsch-like isoform X2 n=1 Tax=Homarus americanus TaxID=6706 RepID=UPI001C4419FB|nr:microtubule-associated protein futsch-like isoform X2 [Homarus americanus]
MKDPNISLASKDKAIRHSIKSSSSSRLTPDSKASSAATDMQERASVRTPSANSETSSLSPSYVREGSALLPNSEKLTPNGRIEMGSGMVGVQTPDGSESEESRSGMASRMSMGAVVEQLMAGGGKRNLSSRASTIKHQIKRFGGAVQTTQHQQDGDEGMIHGAPTIRQITTYGYHTPSLPSSPRDTPVQVHEPTPQDEDFVMPSSSISAVVGLAMAKKNLLSKQKNAEKESDAEISLPIVLPEEGGDDGPPPGESSVSGATSRPNSGRISASLSNGVRGSRSGATGTPTSGEASKPESAKSGSVGKSAKSQVRSRSNSSDRSSKYEVTSRPSSTDRAAASGGTSRPTSRDRTSRPTLPSRPNSRERPPQSGRRSRPNSRDRATSPSVTSRPNSRERASKTDLSQRPSSRDRASDNTDNKINLETVDEHNEAPARSTTASSTGPAPALSRQSRSVIVSAKRFLKNDTQFPSTSDLSRPTKILRHSAASSRSFSRATGENQDSINSYKKVPKESTAESNKSTETVKGPQKEESKELQKSQQSVAGAATVADNNVKLKDSRSVTERKMLEKLDATEKPKTQPLPEVSVFTVDIPLLIDDGVPRLQTPKLIIPRPVDTDGQVVQELKSLRSAISALDEKDEEDDGASRNGCSSSSGIERSRSLVAITAEENFLYVHGQTPRSGSSLSHNSASEEHPGPQISHSTSSNHSQETQVRTISLATNKSAVKMNEKPGNQSASSKRANADQSIPQDGVVGSTTGVKSSGGKLSVSASGPSDVVVSGGAEENDASDPQKVVPKVKEDAGTNSSAKAKDSEKVLSSVPQHDPEAVVPPSTNVAGPSRSTDRVVGPSTSLRGDVLVEALVESAKSNSGDKTSVPTSPRNSAMPFQTTPRGTSLSAVEVPEGTLSTVSLAVSKNESGVSRPLAVRDHASATTGIFDRLSSTKGSLWQKAQVPLVVKPSSDPYSREPREYEDYMPREAARPLLQRRGSLGKIDVNNSYDDDYYDDDDYDDRSLQNWRSRVRESRGAQTVRVKNQQPRHSILKKTDTRPTQKKEEFRSSLKERIHEDFRDSPPIIIASGLVPKNLESLTSEYQAAHQGEKDEGANSNSVNGYKVSDTAGTAPYGANTTSSYNSYPANGNNRIGNAAGSRNYPTKDRDQFHERYLEPASGTSVTAPLVASQQKQNIGDVFDRLHSNRRSDVPTVASRKPEIKPKPKTIPPKARDPGVTSTIKGPAPEPQRRQQQQQNTSNDVFSRLYQNAPSRKRRDEISEPVRLLEVPGAPSHQLVDSAPPPLQDSIRGSPRGTKDYSSLSIGRQGRSDTHLNMPMLAPDIVVDDMGEPTPVHRGRKDDEAYKRGGGGGNDKLPIVLLQGFFRGLGSQVAASSSTLL